MQISRQKELNISCSKSIKLLIDRNIKMELSTITKINKIRRLKVTSFE